MKNQADIVQRLISKEIYLNQSHLVPLLLEKEILDYDDIVNYYAPKSNINEGDECEDMEPQEIFEWWVVSDYLCEQLKKVGAPVLDSDYGMWWGRTETGQSLEFDGSLNSIAEKMITK